jgi:DNA-binding HxlR family transcriptional regulator
MKMTKFIDVDNKKLSRKSDPATSKQAVKTKTLQQWVYEIIASYHNGCILDQVLTRALRERGRISTSSISSRFCELERQGFIEYKGTRKGLSGRHQRIARAK